MAGRCATAELKPPDRQTGHLNRNAWPRMRVTTGVGILLATVLLVCFGIMETSALQLGPSNWVSSPQDPWTATTCIASDPKAPDSSFIGGYFTKPDGTSDFKMRKRADGLGGWNRTISADVGRKSFVLGCTADSSGNVYVTTASNVQRFDEQENTFSQDTYGLFLSKLSGINGDTIWRNALGRTNGGPEDALDVAWDASSNTVVIFGQMHVQGRDSTNMKQATILRFNAVCGNPVSDTVTFGLPDTTIASRVLIGNTGEMFVLSMASTAVNGVNASCGGAGCQTCFVSKYDQSHVHSWTQNVTANIYCYGATFALDRGTGTNTNNLAVYVNVRNAQSQNYTVFRHLINSDGSQIGGRIKVGGSTTIIGAVFMHNKQTLVSGVTSEDISINFLRPGTCSTCMFTFIAQLDIDLLSVKDVKYFPRVDYANGMESRRSGMVHSTSSSKVTWLTTMKNDGASDKNVLQVVTGRWMVAKDNNLIPYYYGFLVQNQHFKELQPNI